MTKYNTYLQFNQLKPGIKNGIKVILNLSLNVVVVDSSNENNFSHKFLLIDTQVSRICTNGSLANI